MARKMENGYFYDIFRNTLIITKAFERKASRIGSTEYRLMLDYRKAHADLKVAYWKENTRRKSGLSYRQMEAFIALHCDKEERLARFEAMKKLAQTQRNPYQFMKEWFEENYPTYQQNPQLNEEGYLISAEAMESEAV